MRTHAQAPRRKSYGLDVVRQELGVVARRLGTRLDQQERQQVPQLARRPVNNLSITPDTHK